MRLNRIQMTNFKQYKGIQIIDFAGSSETEEQNVTVVYGENGRGKTTLYRSILFGFYGDKTLEQDDNDNNDSTIYLANLKALDEAFEEGVGIDVGVSISFNHQGEEYEISRHFTAIKDSDNNIFEDIPSVKLSIIRSDGNTENFGDDQEEKIQEVMNSILDERVKNYFLFDGERIESLTKATKTQKKNIQSGITNLLKIDNLLLLKDALKQNKRLVTQELKKISTGDMLKNLKDLEDKDAEIQSLEERIEDYNSELTFAEREKETIDAKLREVEGDRPTLNKILQLEKEVSVLENELSEYNQHLVEATPLASILLAKDVVGELIADLDGKRIRGEVPSEIKTELIDRLLDELSCICGREIQIGSEEYNKLIDWKKKSTTQVLEKHAMSLFGDLRETAGFINNNNETLTGLLESIAVTEERIERLTNDIELYRKQVGDLSEDQIVKDFDLRDRITEKIGKKKQEIIELEKLLDEKLEQRKELDKERKSLTVENEHQAQIKRREEIIDSSLEALEKIINKFIVEVREELQLEANKIFSNLIDTSGSTNLKEIIVNKDYTLDVLDWNGRPFLANISAGQRQVVSLSFITALAKVAGGTTTLEIPLFMDTPFGRLSPDHRQNLVQFIPDITPQWVLLVTGSEFGVENEAKYLNETNKWGKFYMLDSVSEGETRIREMSPSEFFAIKA